MSNEALEIPLLPKFANYRFGVTIENHPYLFEPRWNTRDFAWYLNILEVTEEPIVYGVKVVLGTYLGRRSNHKLFRQGVLVAVDTTGEGRDATYDDFGTRVILEYIPVLELIRRLRAFR